jgi:hypothetical protein
MHTKSKSVQSSTSGKSVNSQQSNEMNEANMAEKEASLTNAEIEKLTAPCVKQLNSLYRKNTQLVLEMGKLVHEFMLRVTENRTKWVNAYKMLEEYPGSLLHESQLRTYEGAFQLHEELKEHGKSAKVSVSHFGVVLNSKIDPDSKAALLKMAEEKEWSVSQLKKHIASTKAA